MKCGSRIGALSRLRVFGETIDPAYQSHLTETVLAEKKGIRVNELAKELGVESKAILAKLQEEGLGDRCAQSHERASAWAGRDGARVVQRQSAAAEGRPSRPRRRSRPAEKPTHRQKAAQGEGAEADGARARRHARVDARRAASHRMLMRRRRPSRSADEADAAPRPEAPRGHRPSPGTMTHRRRSRAASRCSSNDAQRRSPAVGGRRHAVTAPARPSRTPPRPAAASRRRLAAAAPPRLRVDHGQPRPARDRAAAPAAPRPTAASRRAAMLTRCAQTVTLADRVAGIAAKVERKPVTRAPQLVDQLAAGADAGPARRARRRSPTSVPAPAPRRPDGRPPRLAPAPVTPPPVRRPGAASRSSTTTRKRQRRRAPPKRAVAPTRQRRRGPDGRRGEADGEAPRVHRSRPHRAPRRAQRRRRHRAGFDRHLKKSRQRGTHASGQDRRPEGRAGRDRRADHRQVALGRPGHQEQRHHQQADEAGRLRRHQPGAGPRDRRDASRWNTASSCRSRKTTIDGRAVAQGIRSAPCQRIRRTSCHASAGRHHPRPRRPRQDQPAGQDPQRQRRRRRSRRHHAAHRRVDGARSAAATRQDASPSSTRPATRPSPPCAPAART